METDLFLGRGLHRLIKQDGEQEEDPSPDIPVSAAPLTETVIND